MSLQAELRTFHGAIGTLFEALQGSVLREPPSAQPIPVSERPRIVATISTGIKRLRGAPDPPIARAEVLRLALAFAVLSEDPAAATELAGELNALGEPLEVVAAVRLAEAGQLDEALASVTARSEFIAARQKVDILEDAAETARALELARTAVAQWPRRAALEFAYARLLAPTDPAQAVLHARAAFEDMPGLGQRLLLVRCLLASGDASEAWRLLEGSDDEKGALKLRAVVAEQAQPSRALEYWNKYLAAFPQDFGAHLRVAAVLARFGRAEEAAEAAWKAFELSAEQDPSIAQIRGFGLLQFGVEAETRDRRLREILRLLTARFRGNPEAEGVYLEIWTRLKDPAELVGPDFNLLASAGLATAVPVEQIIEMVTSTAKSNERARAAYLAGALSFESLCSLLRMPASQVIAQLLGDGSALAFFHDISPPDDQVLEGRNLLVSELELVLFSTLGVLEEVRVALGPAGKIVLFSDVEQHLLTTSDSDDLERAGADRRRAISVASFAAQIEVSQAKRDVLDIDEAVGSDARYVLASEEDGPTAHPGAWLRLGSGNAAPSRNLGGSDGKTPSYLLSLPALIQLGEQGTLQRYLRGGGRWRLGPRAAAELASWLRTAEAKEQFAVAAAQARRWCGAMREAGQLRTIERPEVSGLPAMRSAENDLTRRTVQRSLSYREALAQNPDLMLAVADFAAADALLGLAAHPGVFLAFAWDAETYPALAKRIRATNSRTLDFGSVLRRVVPRDSRLETLQKAVVLGLADALSAEDLHALVQSVGVDTVEFASLLAGAVVVGGSESMPRGSLAQLCLARQWARCAWQATKAEFADTDGLVRSLLDASWSVGDKRTGVMVESFLGFLLAEAVESPRISLVQAPDSKSWVLSPATRAGVVWTSVHGWLRGHPAAAWAFVEAVVTTLTHLDQAGVNEVRLAPVLLAIDCVTQDGTVSSEAIDAAIAILSFGWDVKPAKRLHVAFDDLEEPIEILGEEVLTTAVANFASPSRHLQKRKGSLMVAIKVRDKVVWVPAAPEAVLLRMPAAKRGDAAHVVSAMLGALDGGLNEGLTRLRDPTTALGPIHDFALQAVRSPWRVVANHPEAFLDWAQTRGFTGAFPHDLQDLLRLLSEVEELPNDDLVSILGERAQRGEWANRADRWALLEQATAMPGMVGGMLAASRVAEENFEDEVSNAHERLSSPNSQPVGWLTCDVVTLRVAAQLHPARRLGKGKGPTVAQAFREALETVLESIRSAPPTLSLAATEPILLRLCARVVERLASRTRLSRRDGMWLVYRLFQWLTTVVAEAGCARLAAAQPEQTRQLPPTPDVLDPIRFGQDRFRYRAAAVLHALHQGTAMALAQDETAVGSRPRQRSKETLWSARTLAILQELATAPLTADELELRAMERAKPDLGWGLALAAGPDLALLVLVDSKPTRKAAVSTEVAKVWCDRLVAGEFDSLRPDISVPLVETIVRAVAHSGGFSRRELTAVASAVDRAAGSGWDPEHHVLARIALAFAGTPNSMRDMVELVSRVEDEGALRRCLRLAFRALPVRNVVTYVRRYKRALVGRTSIVREEVAAMASRASLPPSARARWKAALAGLGGLTS